MLRSQRPRLRVQQQLRLKDGPMALINSPGALGNFPCFFCMAVCFGRLSFSGLPRPVLLHPAVTLPFRSPVSGAGRPFPSVVPKGFFSHIHLPVMLTVVRHDFSCGCLGWTLRKRVSSGSPIFCETALAYRKSYTHQSNPAALLRLGFWAVRSKMDGSPLGK